MNSYFRLSSGSAETMERNNMFGTTFWNFFPYLMLGVFLIGLVFVAFEHHFQVHKAWPAFTVMTIIWGTNWLVIPEETAHNFVHSLLDAGKTAAFVYWATCLTELPAKFRAFDYVRFAIAKRGWSDQKQWLIVGVAIFCISALMDNVSTSMMGSHVLKGLFQGQNLLLVHALTGNLANAGGVFLVSGDVTTNRMVGFGVVSQTTLLVWALPPSVVFLISLMRYSLPQLTVSTPDDSRPEVLRLTEWFVVALALLTFPIAVLFHFLAHVELWMGYMIGFLFVAGVNHWFRFNDRFLPRTESKHRQHSVFSIMHAAHPKAALFILFIVLAVQGLKPLGSLDPIVALYALSANPYWTLFLHFWVGAFSSALENVALLEMMLQALSGYNEILWAFLAFTIAVGAGLTSFGSTSTIMTQEINKELTTKKYQEKGFWPVLKSYLWGSLAFIVLFTGYLVWNWVTNL